MKIGYLVAGLLFLPLLAIADDFTISAPAGIRPPLQDILETFKKGRPELTTNVVAVRPADLLAPSGEAETVDLVISEDSAGLEALRKERLLATAPKPFAIGRIVLWARRDSGADLRKGLEVLLEKEIDQIAVPNPQGDPTGVRVKQALNNAQLWSRVERKFLVAEDPAQAVLLIADGTSTVAIVPLALALTPPLKGSGFYYQINDDSYQPIVHSYAIFAGGNAAAAKDFAKLLESRDGQKVLKRYGFSIPSTKPPQKPGGEKPASPPAAGTRQ